MADQLVVAKYRDQSIAFEGHVIATPERVFIVATDTLGRKAMSITWTDESLTWDVASWVPAQLRPENVVGDFALMFWPEQAVGQSLSGTSATLKTGPGFRAIALAEKEIVRIDYAAANSDDPWMNHLTYANRAFGYELDIQSVEPEP